MKFLPGIFSKKEKAAAKVARQYAEDGQFEEAILPYEKAVEIDPGDIRIWESLGDLYTTNKMPEKAKEAKAKAEELKNL